MPSGRGRRASDDELTGVTFHADGYESAKLVVDEGHRIRPWRAVPSNPAIGDVWLRLGEAVGRPP